MIAQSGDVRATRWALVGCDPLQRLRADAMHFPSRLFTLHEHTFELRLHCERGRRLHFNWRNVASGLQPPLSGTVEISKLGRVAVFALTAAYWFEEDAALRLLQAGVGAQPAREALRLASSAILSLVTRQTTQTEEGARRQIG